MCFCDNVVCCEKLYAFPDELVDNADCSFVILVPSIGESKVGRCVNKELSHVV